jgi:DNA invertase Pin-like site-specific DNA recombinase
MPDGDPRDYVLYLRKSKGRSGIPRQRNLTTTHIERRVGGKIIGEFTDTGRTAFQKVGGARPVRDGFTAMLAMLRANPGLGVGAWHADRLTRNSEDTEELIRVCTAGGHIVETPRGGSYDLATATGRKRLRDDANDAAYEVDHAIERITAMKLEHAADGHWLGGRRPFGYEADGVTLRPDEAAAIAQGTKDVVSGAHLAAVARSWNARGLVTSAGRQWDNRAVSRVLSRARNAGMLEHNGQIAAPAQWPAVVTENEWRAVAAILSDPGRKTTPGPARRHLLTFIATCGVCGEPVFCTTVGAGGKRRKVYRCRKDTRGHVARDVATLDEYVTAWVIARLSRPDAAAVLRGGGGQDVMLELQREKAAIRALMKERDQLHTGRIITTEMLVEGMRKLKAELAQVEQKITEASRTDVLAPLVGDPARVWEGLSLDQRRAVIAAIMTITIMPARKGRPAGWKPGQPYFAPKSVIIRGLR